MNIVSYTPTSIQLSTESQVPKLLFLSDVYDRGWKVMVDDKIGEILRADFDFRAVGIPSGNHRITFMYRPEEFSYGLFFSGLSCITLVFYGTVKFISKRQQHTV